MHRKNSVFHLKFNYIKPYLPFTIFTFVFLFGILIGSLLVGRIRSYFDLSANLFSDFFTVRKSLNLYLIFKDSVLSAVLPFIILFLFGTSIVGFVFVPIIVCALGIQFGFLAGYLYIVYRLNGIMFSGLIILPATIVLLFGIILLSMEAFHFSKTLSTICIKSNKPINIYSEFKLYTLKSVITLVAPLISVILDICMTTLFVNYFNF